MSNTACSIYTNKILRQVEHATKIEAKILLAKLTHCNCIATPSPSASRRRLPRSLLDGPYLHIGSSSISCFLIRGRGRGGWWPAWPRQATSASAARGGTRTRAAMSAHGSATASPAAGACRPRWGTPPSCRRKGARGEGRAWARPAAGWAEAGGAGPAAGGGCGGGGTEWPIAGVEAGP